ncbi:hypothetical protein DAI22_11g225000 [Oryza sativa Japonica Group]|jgi:hypothetical protein|nr:hypothetical protein DAI22_11g225000 [Oryza sativa Japonica Group]
MLESSHFNVYLSGRDWIWGHGESRRRWSGRVGWKQDVVDTIETTSDVYVADEWEDEEVRVDPALNISEPLSLPPCHHQPVHGALVLARQHKLVRLPERVVEPGQRPPDLRPPKHLRILQVLQQLGDREDAAGELLALLLVLLSRHRSLHDHGDEAADVRPDQLRHRGRVPRHVPQCDGTKIRILFFVPNKRIDKLR